MRRHVPLALAILSIPAGLVGYFAAAAVLGALVPGIATNTLGMLVSLFVAGLCMIPFVAPWFDAMAKRDLARIRAMREDEEARRGSPPPE